jgi:hypothetical protein
LNLLNASPWGTNLQFPDHGLNHAPHSFDISFDSAIVEIPHSADQSSSRSRMAREGAITDPLHMTDNEESCAEAFV